MMENKTDGLLSDDITKQLLKHLKNYKEGKILEESFYVCSHELANEMINHYGVEIAEKHVKQQMIEKLLSNVVHKHKDSIKKEYKEYNDVYRYSLELLIMKPEDLKYVIDYIIRTLDEKTLNKIRNAE